MDVAAGHHGSLNRLRLMIKHVLLLTLLLVCSSIVQAQSPMVVMTYNIRLDLASDGGNAWSARKADFASMLRYHKADIVGLQEAMRNQIDDIIAALPEYGWCGVGRDDGKNAGEFMAILYRKSRFDMLTTRTFWCSPTPSKPGRGWDAAYNRVVTWAKLRDKKDRASFYFFNTHLDNEGTTARREGARLLVDSIASITGRAPVVITGDFNSTPIDEPYLVVTTNTLKKFHDARTISGQRPHGPVGTFNDFSMTAPLEGPIDFVFVTTGISVLSHGTLSESFNGRYPSDHFPVAAEITIGKSMHK